MWPGTVPTLRVLSLPRSALTAKGATRPPGRRLGCVFTDCGRRCIHMATYVQLRPDRLSAHEKARGEAGFCCPEWPCMVSRGSCAILLIQCSSPQKGPTRREEARALALSSRCWVRTWRHSCCSTSMVVFCVEPGRDGDGRPAWSRIQELPYCVSNILLKNPVVCQYVSFQFSSGKFHWQEKYL